MSPLNEMQCSSSRKPRPPRRQRIDRIVRRAVRRAVCQCSEPRPQHPSGRVINLPV